MPRKVQPRWGDTGVARVPDFKFSADQLAAIAGILEIDSAAAIAKLKSELESIGARCRLWFQQDEKGPSWAEQNAARQFQTAKLSLKNNRLAGGPSGIRTQRNFAFGKLNRI
jgi:hypothetical protein